MDERLRQLERGDDPQAHFNALRRAGNISEACTLVKNHSIQTTVTVEYWYSYRFLRNNGSWHSHPEYLARTPGELAPIVAKTIRSGYIARSMTITGRETQRGQLIRVPVMELAGVVCRLEEDKDGLFTLQVVEDQQVFKEFMMLVINHRRNSGRRMSNNIVTQYISE